MSQTHEPTQVLRMRKLAAEIRKISHECDKLILETRWYPFIVVAAMVAAFGGIQRLLS